MGRVTKVVTHLRVEEIALEVGLARQTVHNLVAAYNRQGPQTLETPGHGQRQRAYLSLEREQAVVDKLLQKSAKGQVSTGSQIKPALEKAIGQPVHKTTVYRLLKRHGSG